MSANHAVAAETTAVAKETAAGATTSAAETTKRRSLHAYLSHNAHETWHQFAASHRVSVSATLEALATELDDAIAEKPHAAIDFAPIVQRAHQTDASRHR